MNLQDASTREDIIEDAAEREVASADKAAIPRQSTGTSLDPQLEHDLLVWPREHLESYLDSDSTGRVALNEAHLQGVLESAFERSEELLRSAIQPALTDSGIYVGTVIWKGQELLLQRISVSNAILHCTGQLNETPQIGELVRIAYSNGIGTVDEVALQRPSRELGR
jgi:hypothetical protein